MRFVKTVSKFGFQVSASPETTETKRSQAEIQAETKYMHLPWYCDI